MMQMHGGHKEEEESQYMMGAKTPEDYEAYLKWCEDRKITMMQQQQHQELIKEFEREQEEKKRE